MVKKKEDYSIKITNLNKDYKNGKRVKKKVFENFNIEFEKGSIHCVLGVSGCGKSTLLRIIAGVEEYESGNIEFLDKVEDEIFISMILQENNLLPWLTVYKNIEFALNSCNIHLSEEEIDKILEKHNLLDFKNFYPFELSVGLKQKVALCKAINTNPKVVLLDEPFCALDFISKENIHDIFLRSFKDRAFTSILSTHYLEEAVKLGDYIHLLGKNGKYTKVKNPLKYPREKDKGYNDFLEKIKNLYV